MRLLLETSGEHPTLPAAEALGAAETLGRATIEKREPGVAILETEGVDARALAWRLALSHAVIARWFSAPPDPAVVLPRVAAVNLAGARFAVRGRRVEAAHPAFPVRETEIAMGKILRDTGTVDLANPEVEVRFLVSEEVHVGALVAEVDRKAFESRTVKNRPFFHPVSLHPKFVRALANLARLRAGERVLDPFCGTGGFSLEAALLGARVVASDLDARMVAGTRETLAHYGCDAAFETRDVGEMPELADAHGGKADLVFTDPPYARSSTTNREDLDKLYDRFFHAARDALRPGGRLAALFPDERHVARAAQLFELVEHHPLRVHASMTRHFTVLKRR